MPGRRLRYRLNVRFVGTVLAAVLTAAVGLYLLHRYQRGHQADVFLRQADAAEEAGDLGKASDYLGRYLIMAPGDQAARGRYGLALARLANTPKSAFQAYLVLDEAVRGLPDRTDLRRRAAEVGLMLGPDLVADVKQHLDRLIAAAPADGDLEALMATCLEVQGDYAQAVKRLEAAAAKKPGLYAAAVRRAVLLRQRLNQPEDADKVVEELQAVHPDDAAAQLAAAAYWEECDKPDRREAAVAAARKAAPTDLGVELAVAGVARRRAEVAAGQGDVKAAAAASEEVQTGLAAALARHAGTVKPVDEKAVAGLSDADRLQRVRVATLYEAVAETEAAAGKLAEAEATVRRGVEALPESTALRVALVDVLLRRGSFDPAGKELDRLEVGGYPPAAVAYQRGRLLAGQGRWLDAARVLDGVVQEPKVGEQVAASAALLLGNCWGQLGELDRRYAAYRRAAGTDPRSPVWAEANAALAAVLAETGQEDEAATVYARLVGQRRTGAAVPLARLYLQAVLRQPAGKRDWGRVEDALKPAPDGPAKEVARAELLAAKGDPAAARQVLTAAQTAHPDALDVPVALAVLENGAGQPERAREVMATARTKFGATPTVRLAEATLAVRPAGPDTPAALKRAGDGAEGLPPADARRVLRALAELATVVGSADLAAGFRDRLLALAPDDLTVLLARVDDAVRRKDAAVAQAAVDRVRAVDGPDGTSTRAAQAAYLVMKAQAGEPGGLVEADELLAAVQKQRPWWPRAAAGRGLVADLRGDPSTAAARYREAVDAGDRRPEVVGRLLELYVGRKQYREAEELLTRLPADAVAGSGQLVAEVSARTGNLTRAVQAAEAAVPEDSRDPARLLWLASVRRAAGVAVDRVERPIRRAVELAPAEPAPRVALVQFLAATGRKPEAEAATKAAEAAVQGPGRAAALGECFAAVGALDKAAEQFAAAVAPADAGLSALRAAASFHLSVGAADKAEPLCRRILDARGLADGDRQFAVRALVEALAARRNPAAARQALEALGMLDKGLPAQLTGGESVEQLRTRAIALALQPDPRSRRAAVAALEAVEARQPLAADEQFRLAGLYLSVGEWAKARGRLLPLAQATPPNLAAAQLYVAGAVYLDGDPKEARRFLPALLTARPDDPATVQLQAAVLNAEGKAAEAAETALRFAAGSPARAGQAAGMLERLGLWDRAEPLYRRRAEGGEPQAVAALAAYLGRQGRTRDALAALREVAGKLPPAVVAQLGVEVMYNATAVDPADARLVEGWVAAVPGALRSSLTGVLRMAEGRFPEAVEACRAAATASPPDAPAMNNLGYLLAVNGGRPDEGLEWVRKAQQVAGPLPALLDTEGLILTRLGQAERAAEVLTEASQNLSDPAALVHLAQAQKAAGNPAEAAAALRLAKRRNVRPIDLPPPERAGLADALAGRG